MYYQSYDWNNSTESLSSIHIQKYFWVPRKIIFILQMVRMITETFSYIEMKWNETKKTWFYFHELKSLSCNAWFLLPVTCVQRLQFWTIRILVQVKEISRVFSVVDGELSYVVQMATNLNNLQPHLKAWLRKL